MSAWIYLCVAIVAEVIATSALSASAGFTRLVPSVVVVVGYALAFWMLGLSLKTIPVGIAYAIWAGAGIVLISLIGWIVLRQALDLAAVLGMGLIVAGVVVIHVFSRTVAH